jgi:transcriptional regulator with XRE-family HTH domain
VAGLARNVRKEFAERLQQAMNESGYTDKKELGALLGLTAQAIRKWYEAEAIPSAEHAPRLAEVLGVRRAWLLDGELPMRPLNMAEKGSGYAAEDSSLSPEEFRLVVNFRSLPHEVRAAFAQLLETMKLTQKRKA